MIKLKYIKYFYKLKLTYKVLKKLNIKVLIKVKMFKLILIYKKI